MADAIQQNSAGIPPEADGDSTPVPLTVPDCDLREFAFMPLDVQRLCDSDLSALTTGDEFRAAVFLWCKAWHQVPAGSLPDDDRVLAQFAGYGRVVAEWMKVRDGAMRGWVKCSDGRWYHPVVSEKANASWDSMHKHAYDKLVDRVRKKDKTRTLPTFEQWKAMGRPMEADMFPPEGAKPSGGVPPETPSPSAGVPSNSTLNGEGEVTENKDKDKTLVGQTAPDDSAQGQIDLTGDTAPPADPPKDDAREILAYLNAKTGSKFEPVDSNLKRIRARLAESTPEKVRAVIDAKVAEWTAPTAKTGMSQYLRPATLFAAENFANYVGQLGAPVQAATTKSRFNLSGMDYTPRADGLPF